MIKFKDKDRCILVAEYVIENSSTVRSAAKHFGISKSTIHKDLTERLKYISPNLYSDVKKVLNINKSERHVRGGEATRKKYLRKKAEFAEKR